MGSLSSTFGQQTDSQRLRYELFEHKLFVVHTKNDNLQESVTSKTDSMRYRLLFPKNYDKNKKYPLVLFLHGAGERGDSSLTVKHIGAWALQEKNRENYNCFVLVPQCEKNNKWVEVDNDDNSFLISDFELSPDKKESSLVMVFKNHIKISFKNDIIEEEYVDENFYDEIKSKINSI